MENQRSILQSGSSFMNKCNSACINEKDYPSQALMIVESPQYTNNNNASDNHQNTFPLQYMEHSFTVKQEKNLSECVETDIQCNEGVLYEETQDVAYNFLHQPDSSTAVCAVNEKKMVNINCQNHEMDNNLDKKRLERLQKDRERKRKLRQDPEYRAMERSRDSERHRRLRMDPEYREAERKRNSEHHRLARQNPEYKARERAKDLERHKRLRSNPEYKEKESLRNAEHYQTACLRREYLQTVENLKHDTALMSVLRERFNTTEHDLFSLISSGWLS